VAGRVRARGSYHLGDQPVSASNHPNPPSTRPLRRRQRVARCTSRRVTAVPTRRRVFDSSSAERADSPAELDRVTRRSSRLLPCSCRCSELVVVAIWRGRPRHPTTCRVEAVLSRSGRVPGGVIELLALDERSGERLGRGVPAATRAAVSSPAFIRGDWAITTAAGTMWPLSGTDSS